MALPDCQHEVGAFLTALAGAPPVETHISAVFVGADTVWKLKKAVCLSFLDFSALDERRRFLRREIELNQPHAPGIYGDVAAIERAADGSLVIRPERECGAPLDFVLRLARIPDDAFLDRVAECDGLKPELLDALGDCVAHDHSARPAVDGIDSAVALRLAAAGAAAAARSAGLPSTAIDRWLTDILRALDAAAGWLNQRAASGFVRRCHGDLHLGNLCLWGGAPVPFDALEFDEALATIDVGYDLAFLVMDLDCRVSRGAANRVFNRYLARTGDVAVVRGLPAFLSLRAMVRAFVVTASGKPEQAEPYLRAASAYLEPAAPVTVAIGGLPGTGKSTQARRLAPSVGPAPGAVILRSDEIRKRRFGVAPEQRLPEAAYAPSIDAAVAEELVALAGAVASAGHAVIGDATFLNDRLRATVAVASRAAGVPFVGVWLTAKLDVLDRRISVRRNDASDADAGVLHAMAATAVQPAGWLIVDAADGDIAAAHIARAADVV
jgi:uncharacterized protein